MTDTEPTNVEKLDVPYDQLLENRPAIFAVDKHQTFPDSGIILVSCPPALDMVPVAPGRTLHCDYVAGEGVLAYTVTGGGERQADPDTELSDEQKAKADEELRASLLGLANDLDVSITADEAELPLDQLQELVYQRDGENQDATANPPSAEDEAADHAETVDHEFSDEQQANLDLVPEGEDHPWHKGGGIWILSSGDTFQGNKVNAIEAEKVLDGEPPDGE